MGFIQPIEQNGQRVLTTLQLAESFGTDSRRISENFNANKDRYTEGKHYFLLVGASLRAFAHHYGNSVSVNRVSKMYLWTEKGAWMHAKSLNTDEAWNAYERLVDDYYRVKTEVQQIQLPRNYREALVALLEEVEKNEQLEEQNRLMQPKAHMYDLLLSADNSQTVGEVAKAFGWGRNRLFAFLRDQGVLMKNNLPYQRYLDSDYFEVREVTTVRGDNTINVTQTLVTPKGIDFIGRLLNETLVPV